MKLFLNIVIGIIVFSVFVMTVLGISFLVDRMFTATVNRPYLEKFNGDVVKMEREIVKWCNNSDPEVSGKGSSFTIVGASGKVYFVPSVAINEESRSLFHNRYCVQFSREEVIDIVIGDVASGHKIIPDNENYLFVKQAIDEKSDYFLEDLFYRRFYIPLEIMDEDETRSKLNEAQVLEQYELGWSYEAVRDRESEWMRENLCVN